MYLKTFLKVLKMYNTRNGIESVLVEPNSSNYFMVATTEQVKMVATFSKVEEML